LQLLRCVGCKRDRGNKQINASPAKNCLILGIRMSNEGREMVRALASHQCGPGLFPGPRKNEEGSCYLVVPCANPSDRQHKRGGRFIAIFLFSVASLFKNEEGEGCPIHPNWLDSCKVVTTCLESTRIVRCVVDSITRSRFARHLANITQKANREGRKSGRIDSIRVDSTRIVLCIVDSTNWKGDLQDTYKKSHKKANREGSKSGRIDSICVDSTRIV